MPCKSSATNVTQHLQLGRELATIFTQSPCCVCCSQLEEELENVRRQQSSLENQLHELEPYGGDVLETGDLKQQLQVGKR